MSSERSDHHTARDSVSIFAIALGFYAATLAPGVIWGDSASLAIDALNGSVSFTTAGDHPLFILVGRWFSSLPGDAARNVVADVSNLIERKRVFIVADGQDAVGFGSVFANHDSNDAFELFGAASVDAPDARMRVGRMQNLADQHARSAEVVCVLAGAGGLARSIDHRDRFADNGKVVNPVVGR